MKALIYQGPGKKAFESRPMPQIAGLTDAIVKMLKTTVCGHAAGTGALKVIIAT
jgi:alcohol dehydrogenase